MKFLIEPPPPMELTGIETNSKTGMTLTPYTVRGQPVLKSCYITAIGSNGNQAKAVVMFNTNTGEFMIRRMDSAPAPLAFDKPPSEFQSKREASSKNIKKANQEKQDKANKDAAAAGTAGPTGPVPVPVQKQPSGA